MKVARWFGTPFNAWYVGKIVQINKRRTKQDNVSAEFNDETYGTTWGHWPAASDRQEDLLHDGGRDDDRGADASQF